FFFYCSAHHCDLHSFPTRRSSDLTRSFAGCPASLSTTRHATTSKSFWLTHRTSRPTCAITSQASAPTCARCWRSSTSTTRSASRSEEHTSELQSPCKLECRLPLQH